MTTVTLIRKDGCHLCDVAHGVIEQVLAELPEADADRVEVRELSIEDDAELSACGGRRSRSCSSTTGSTPTGVSPPTVCAPR